MVNVGGMIALKSFRGLVIDIGDSRVTISHFRLVYLLSALLTYNLDFGLDTEQKTQSSHKVDFPDKEVNDAIQIKQA